MRRLSERELRAVANLDKDQGLLASPSRDAMAYRRALRKVRRYFEPRALEGSMSGALALQQLNIIDRALGAKR